VTRLEPAAQKLFHYEGNPAGLRELMVTYFCAQLYGMETQEVAIRSQVHVSTAMMFQVRQ
jgi:hypothetical protein